MSCYRQLNGREPYSTSDADRPCNIITTTDGVSPCCPLRWATDNLCLSDYLCWTSVVGEGGTGFMTASCTDEQYESSECTSHCTNNSVNDIVYNPQTKLWACCSWSLEDGIDCQNPTNETWVAPAPEVLKAAASASSTIGSTASTTSINGASSSSSSPLQTPSPTSSSSSPSETPNPASSSPGLSTGAKAGVGIGAAIGAIALLLLLFYTVPTWRRRQQKLNANQNDHDSKYTILEPKHHSRTSPPIELQSDTTRELPSNTRSELPT